MTAPVDDLELAIDPGTTPKPRAGHVALATAPAPPVVGRKALAEQFSQLLLRIEYLRSHERTVRASRKACLTHLFRAIESFREADGPKTGDGMGGILTLDYAELTRPGNPYPVPMIEGETPFDQGRYYNGKFFRDDASSNVPTPDIHLRERHYTTA